MSAQRINGVHAVAFGNGRIEFRLKRSKRKTLAITVRPDTTVRVTAPRHVGTEAVMAKVRKRAVWVLRQQRFFREFLPPLPPRRYVSGETHRYLGRQYRLKVVEAAEESVKLKGRFIFVHTRRKTDVARVRALVGGWYRDRAKERFARSLDECLDRLGGRLGTAPRLLLRRMPKRWGSWTRRGVIWVNPELVKAPSSCVDYVVTHELCHLVHAHHGPKFYSLLRRVMPDWEGRKARLENGVLG